MSFLAFFFWSGCKILCSSLYLDLCRLCERVGVLGQQLLWCLGFVGSQPFFNCASSRFQYNLGCVPEAPLPRGGYDPFKWNLAGMQLGISLQTHIDAEILSLFIKTLRDVTQAFE